MYEIGKEKVVKFNVGNDVMSQDSVSFMTQNTLIAGLPGSGVAKVLDNIIMNLAVNYSPEEVGIQYYSLVGFNVPWVNENRRLPHMLNQTYDEVNKDNASEVFYKNVCNCLAACIAGNRMCDEDACPNEKRKNVIILGLEHEPELHIKDAIYTLMQYTDKYNCGCNVIVVSYNCDSFTQSLAEYAGLRVSTKIDNKLSKCMFVHELDTRALKGGYAWVMERENPYVLQCLSIPFKPDSLYSKICKFLSNDKEFGYDYYKYVHEKLNEHFRDAMYQVLTYYPMFCVEYFEGKKSMESFRNQDDNDLRKLFLELTIKQFAFSRIAPF
jgi:hypothetical protein